MSRKPHTIRLREPWTWLKPVAAAGTAVDEAQLCGERAFHRPTGLGPGTQVQLVVASSVKPTQVRLNGQPLSNAAGTEQPWRAEIHQLLNTRNHLQLDFVSSDETTLATIKDELAAGHVQLEIRE